jgi:selenide,water dikinase
MRKLLLIGGGHSHVEVIRRFARQRATNLHVTLVSPTTHTPYSGMLPGLIAGHYSYRQCHIDLPALARTAGCRYVAAGINGLHADAKLAFCDNGEAIEYDVASIDIGSTPATLGIAGAARHGLKVKPTERFLTAWDAVLERARNRSLRDGFRIVMAGGGAAGVEVLLAIRHRLIGAGFGGAQYAIVSDRDDLLPGHGDRTRALFRRVLKERGVEIYLRRRIVAATRDAAVSVEGKRIAADLPRSTNVVSSASMIDCRWSAGRICLPVATSRVWMVTRDRALAFTLFGTARHWRKTCAACWTANRSSVTTLRSWRWL